MVVKDHSEALLGCIRASGNDVDGSRTSPACMVVKDHSEALLGCIRASGNDVDGSRTSPACRDCRNRCKGREIRPEVIVVTAGAQEGRFNL